MQPEEGHTAQPQLRFRWTREWLLRYINLWCCHLQSSRAVFYLALNVFDRYSAKCLITGPKNLNLAVVSSVFIASKFTDGAYSSYQKHAASIGNLAHYELVEMEAKILQALNFDLMVQTVLSSFCHLCESLSSKVPTLLSNKALLILDEDLARTQSTPRDTLGTAASALKKAILLDSSFPSYESLYAEIDQVVASLTATKGVRESDGPRLIAPVSDDSTLKEHMSHHPILIQPKKKESA
jgi:hypothetical protein